MTLTVGPFYFIVPTTEIIVILYNQPLLENRCVESVRAHTNLDVHKLNVVDNFTRDKNLGALWNELIGKSTAEFICLLNSDTEVEAGWLDKLIACAQQTQAGAVGPMTDHCGTPQQKGIASSGTMESAQLSGFCLLLRKSAWTDARGFREDFGFYGQESNLLLRVKKKIIAKAVFVHHEAGGSVKPTGRAVEERALAAETWRRNTAFDWKQRLAIIGSPDSPFPLWQGINQAVRELKREGMAVKHFANTVPGRDILDFAPTVILVVSQRWDTLATWAKRLKSINAKKGCWFNDLRGGKPAHVLAGAFQKVFLCFQDSPAYPWAEWKRQSKAEIRYMPQASVIHTELAPLDIQRELLFIGGTQNATFHSDRAVVVKALNATVVNEIQRPDRIRVEAQSRELYRQARFSLVMSPRVPGYNSLRLYNVMAYGGLPLVHRFPGLEKLFEDGRHVLGWSSITEARDQMKAWRERPEECEKLRKRAWRYQQSKHTSVNRLMNAVANLTTADQSFWGFRA